MYSHFVAGLRSGKFSKLSPAEIQETAMKNHFSFTPLIPLTSQEESLLVEITVKDLNSILNNKNLEDLCGQVFYDGESFYINGGEKNNPYTKTKPWLLSTDEKLKLLLDPKIWHKKRLYTPGLSNCLTIYGNRDLLRPDGYFNSKSEFRELLEKIRQKAGVSKLIILDIGCGMGKALQDMKELDSNIETHGITMEPEPAMFKADYFHYMVAERMPLEFLGKFHLIVSNMAFRYFLFQNIALMNVVKSMANGGYAEIHFSFEASRGTLASREYFLRKVPGAESNYQAMKTLVRETMAELETLQNDGKIKITPSSNFYHQAMQGGLIIEKISD